MADTKHTKSCPDCAGIQGYLDCKKCEGPCIVCNEATDNYNGVVGFVCCECYNAGVSSIDGDAFLDALGRQDLSAIDAMFLEAFKQ